MAGGRHACGLIKLTTPTSYGLNIQPTISALFLTIIIGFTMIFY